MCPLARGSWLEYERGRGGGERDEAAVEDMVELGVVELPSNVGVDAEAEAEAEPFGRGFEFEVVRECDCDRGCNDC